MAVLNLKQTLIVAALTVSLANPFLASLVSTDATESIPEFKWRAEEIDTIEIGYGLQLADVNGDGKTDIVLADKSTIQWYENSELDQTRDRPRPDRTRQRLHCGQRHRWRWQV